MAVVALLTCCFFTNYTTAYAGNWIQTQKGQFAVLTAASAVANPLVLMGFGIAFVPALATGTAVTAVVAGGYQIYDYFTSASGASKTANSSGHGNGPSVDVPANVQWVDLNNNVQSLDGGTAHVDVSDMASNASTNSSRYPNLSKAGAYGASILPSTAGSVNSSTNGNVKINGVTYGLGALLHQGLALDNGLGHGGPWVSAPFWNKETYQGVPCLTFRDGSSSTSTYAEYDFAVASNPYLTPTNYNSSTFDKNAMLNQMATNGNPVPSTYSADIEQLISDNPQVLKYDNVPSITAANGATVAANSNTAAQTAANGAAASAAQAAADVAAANAAVAAAAASATAASNAVTAAQAALSAAQTAEQQTQAIANLMTTLQNLQAAQAALAAAQQAQNNALIAAATGNGQQIANALQQVANEMGSQGSGDQHDYTGVLNSILSVLNDGFNSIKNAFTNVIEKIGEGVSAIKDGLGDINDKLDEMHQQRLDDDAEIAATDMPEKPKFGTYSSAVTAPDKKDIKGAVSDFVSHSPMVGLINSLKIEAPSEDSVIQFNFHGMNISADFAKWDRFFSAAGTGLLAISHVLGIFIVFRKEG